jgi:hypothetical protein
MATQAQIDANRGNAQRSTGPRTEAGKAAVSQNAIKYGLFCRNLLLRKEDPAALEILRKSVFDRVRPADPFEVLYAERIVVAAWKLQRALAAESKISHESDYLGRIDPLQVHAREVNALQRQQLAYDRAMDRALNQLQKLQKLRERSPEEREDGPGAMAEGQNPENKPNSDPAAGPPA